MKLTSLSKLLYAAESLMAFCFSRFFLQRFRLNVGLKNNPLDTIL